jgi:hypothetical protein
MTTPDPLTDAELAELEELSNAATPGPWFVRQLDDDFAMSLVAVSTVPDAGLGERWPRFDHNEIVAATLIQHPRYVDVADEQWDQNARFIAAARHSIPRLIDEIRRLRQQADTTDPNTLVPQHAPIQPDAAWLAAWHRDIEAALVGLLHGFEGRFGYPPGENAVRQPDPGGLAAAQRLAANTGVAAVLSHFYRHVGEVVLADVGNAYFIHPASHVLRDLTESGLIPLGDADTGALFASDGGGIHFAIATDGAVYRSTAASRDSDFRPVAADLQDFLEQLRGGVIRFLDTGQPGDL